MTGSEPQEVGAPRPGEAMGARGAETPPGAETPAPQVSVRSRLSGPRDRAAALLRFVDANAETEDDLDWYCIECHDWTATTAVVKQQLYDQNCDDAGRCNPPTAIPGTSLHEQGLAIDFTTPKGDFLRAGTTEFAWLQDHADRYGWKNLPSEPWHWSWGPNAGH